MRNALLLFPFCLAACGGPAETDSDPVDDTDTVEDQTPWTAPGEPGPWTTGTSEHLAEGPGVELPVQVWYPASEPGAALHSYDGYLEGSAMDGGVPDCSAPRPVVVFSHGNGGIRYQSIFLTEALAAHGYVVVAPDHVHNTFTDDSGATDEIAIRRPEDISASFDWLVAQSDDPSSDLHGCVDADAGFAVVGHSFGGYTSLAVGGATVDVEALATVCDSYDYFLCGVEELWTGESADPRAWASIPMAPVGRWAFQSGLADMAVPTLVLGGTADELTTWTGEVSPIYEGLTVEPRHLGGLEDAGHFSFTDFCFVLPNADGCRSTDMPIEEAHAITIEAAIGFLDVTRGEARAEAHFPPTHEALEWTTP